MQQTEALIFTSAACSSRRHTNVYKFPGLILERLGRAACLKMADTKYGMILQDCCTVLKHDSKCCNFDLDEEVVDFISTTQFVS